MTSIYNNLIYEPIFNFLVFLYNVVPGNDIGIAIIILTIFIKLAFWPLSAKATKSQKTLQELQPKMEEIKKKYKDNREEQARKLMELYKNEKVNPMSSCLPLLVQFPFLIAVFQVFRNGFADSALELLYPFISNPGHLNSISLGIINLANPNAILALLAGAGQFYQTRMLMHKKQPKVEGAKDENMMAMMNKQMMYIMPLLTVFIGFSLPGGLTLYWLVTTLLSILQQKIIFAKNKKEAEESKI